MHVLTMQCMFLMYSCGEGLQRLVETKEIQNWLSGTPMQTLNQDKAIYQPGALRKVSIMLFW